MTDEEREDLNTFRHDLIKRARWWQWKAETLEKENEQLKAENAALRERLNITKMALEYACLETLQSNEQYLEELKEKVNKYIKQSEDVVYGQKNGVTFRFAESRLAELKGDKQ